MGCKQVLGLDDPTRAPGDAGGGDGVAFDVAVPDAPASVFGVFDGPTAGRSLAAIGDDIVVVGTISAPIDLGGGTPSHPGGRAMFVARYSATGVYRWARVFGSGADEVVNDVATDTVGNIYFVGSIRGAVEFGGPALMIAGDRDAFVVALDRDGEYRWAQRIGAATNGAPDSAHSVAVAPDGNVFVTGLTKGEADAGGAPFECGASEQALFLASYTATGGHRWSRCYGEGPWFAARGAATDGDSNLYVTGYYFGAGQQLGGTALPTTQVQDVFVASYTSAGAYRWARGFGSAGDDWGNAIALDAAGHVYVTGFLATGTPAASPKRTFVRSFTALGLDRWERIVGDIDGCAVGLRIRPGRSGDVVIAGAFGGSISFGGSELVASGAADGFVARLTADNQHVASFTVGGASADRAEGVLATATGVLVTGSLGTSSGPCTPGGGAADGAMFLTLHP
jgi:hypothetical protein